MGEHPPARFAAIVIVSLTLLVSGCGLKAQEETTLEPAVEEIAEAEPIANNLPELTEEQRETVREMLSTILYGFSENREKGIAERIRSLCPIFDLVKDYPQLKEDYEFKHTLVEAKIPQKDIPLLRDYFHGQIGPHEREAALYFLVTTSYVGGDAETGWTYYTMLKEGYPGGFFVHMFSDDDIELMERAKNEEQAILAWNYPEDKRLWLLGQLYVETLQLSWNIVDGVFYDMSCGFGLLSRVVKEFPRSEWADDALFLLTSESEHYGDDEDGDAGVHCELLKEYERLINEYPDSEYVPEAKLSIAAHYTMSIDFVYLEKAKALVEEVLANCPSEECRQKALEVSQSIEEAFERARKASQAEGTSP